MLFTITTAGSRVCPVVRERGDQSAREKIAAYELPSHFVTARLLEFLKNLRKTQYAKGFGCRGVKLFAMKQNRISVDDILKVYLKYFVVVLSILK